MPKLVRVLATGPTGRFETVVIHAGPTGPTGLFPTWGQTTLDDRRFQTVLPAATGASGSFKHVIITGYTGPSG